MLFDSHAHYDDIKFDADRFEILDSMPKNNVGMIMSACSSINDIHMIKEMCNKYDYMFGSVGVHPTECTEMTYADIDLLRKECKNPKIKAIGEIGLDYYYDDVEKSIQKKWFSAQIELAKEEGLPIIVHDREAHADIIDILKITGAGECGGVLHCFSGSCEMAKTILDMGFYIAFGGVLTFKNAKKAVEAAKYIPIERILIETDCPYLAPVPVRGERNSSLFIHYVAEKLAEIKCIGVETVENITFENAKKCFKIT